MNPQLNATDHPKGTRLLLGGASEPAEHEVLEWAPGGRYVKLQLLAGDPPFTAYWADLQGDWRRFKPEVLVVLEKPDVPF